MNPKTWGTYIHGIFDNSCVISSILRENGGTEKQPDFNYEEYKPEESFPLVVKAVK